MRVAVAVLTLLLSCTANALNCCSNFGQGRVGFAHVSHGASLFCIREDVGNKGLNFLFLEYKYR